MVVGGVKILPKNGTVVQWREDKIIDTRLKLKKVKRKIECSDLPLFRKFWKRTHCCRSGIFLWVQFKKIGKICHKCKHADVLIFNKSQGPYKYFFFLPAIPSFYINEHLQKRKFYFRPPKWFLTWTKEKTKWFVFLFIFWRHSPLARAQKTLYKKNSPILG